MIEALRGWEQLSQETGEELGFRRSGLVYATRNEADIAAWDKWGQMAKQYGVRSDILNARQAKAMTPGSATDWLGGVSAPTDGAAEPRLAAPGIVIGAQKTERRFFSSVPCAGWISRRAVSAASLRNAA